jgi:ATP-dependent protease HslVU (ClpYQ) peptidase subunit
MTASDIALKSMKIAADLCVYTNHHTMIEIIDIDDETMKRIDE